MLNESVGAEVRLEGRMFKIGQKKSRWQEERVERDRNWGQKL